MFDRKERIRAQVQESGTNLYNYQCSLLRLAKIHAHIIQLDTDTIEYQALSYLPYRLILLRNRLEKLASKNSEEQSYWVQSV